MSILRKLLDTYYRYYNPVKWARRIGVKVGSKSTLSSTTSFPSEPYLIEIGNNVQITHHVSFFTHGGAHVIRPYIKDFDMFGRIRIEDGVYIGAHSIILPGVNIGKGSLVAAGSVVTKSVPEKVVVAGNPAKIICDIDTYISKNKKYNVSSAKMGTQEKMNFLVSLPIEKLIRK